MGDSVKIEGGNMQLPPSGSGCGGLLDMVSTSMLQIVNPSASSGGAACDKLFRKSSFAEVVERYSTVFPRWVSTTPAVVGGDLRFTCLGAGSPGGAANVGSLEFFANGIDQNQIASNPIPAQTTNAPNVGSIGVGEGNPYPLTFNDTNGLQPMVTGSGNADFVQDEGQDFVFGGMAIEIQSGLFTVVNAAADAVAEYTQPAWTTQGTTSYEERAIKTILTQSNLRISWRDEGQDRFYRVGRPMDWPSYTGAFGSKSTVTAGQPVAFAFKELPFALQTNRRPKVDTNARVKLFLDVPRTMRLLNDPTNQTPVIPGTTLAVPANNFLAGTAFTGVTLKLFGAMVCVDRSTGMITDKPVDVASKMYESVYASLIASGMPPQQAAQTASNIAANASTLGAK